MATNPLPERKLEKHRDHQPIVLVADDHADSLEIVTETLAQIGCGVLCAKDGEDALMKFRRHFPDFVVLDVRMPRLDGLKVCAEIKRLSPYTPVVLVTADGEPEARMAGFDAGAEEYIVKPFFPPELQARFRVLLRQKETQNALVREYERVNRLRDFLPPTAVDAVLGDPGTVPVGAPKRKELTLLFASIRGFTALADALDPQDVRMLLDVYVAEMSDAVLEAGGVVNRVNGDELLAIFNDPAPHERHVEGAVRAAMEMCIRARAIEAGMSAMLPGKFSIGVGVHTGKAIVGRLGRGRYGDYTVVGTTVTAASRVHDVALANRVTVSGAVIEALGNRAQVTNERQDATSGMRIAEIVALRS